MIFIKKLLFDTRNHQTYFHKPTEEYIDYVRELKRKKEKIKNIGNYNKFLRNYKNRNIDYYALISNYFKYYSSDDIRALENGNYLRIFMLNIVGSNIFYRYLKKININMKYIKKYKQLIFFHLKINSDLSFDSIQRYYIKNENQKKVFIKNLFLLTCLINEDFIFKTKGILERFPYLFFIGIKLILYNKIKHIDYLIFHSKKLDKIIQFYLAYSLIIYTAYHEVNNKQYAKNLKKKTIEYLKYLELGDKIEFEDIKKLLISNIKKNDIILNNHLKMKEISKKKETYLNIFKFFQPLMFRQKDYVPKRYQHQFNKKYIVFNFF